MVAQNETPPPAQGPQQAIPRVILLYRQLESGARQVLGIEIAGVRFGGIVAVDTGVDMTRPSNLPPNLVRLNLETLWPFEWKDESTSGVLVAGANDMPPEPKGPRIVR